MAWELREGTERDRRRRARRGQHREHGGAAHWHWLFSAPPGERDSCSAPACTHSRSHMPGLGGLLAVLDPSTVRLAGAVSPEQLWVFYRLLSSRRSSCPEGRGSTCSQPSPLQGPNQSPGVAGWGSLMLLTGFLGAELSRQCRTLPFARGWRWRWLWWWRSAGERSAMGIG